MKFCLAILLALLLNGSIFAQIDDTKRYSEADIAKEEAFVNASQLQLLGKYEEAIEAFEKINKEYEDEVVFFQLSRCYEAIKDYKKAIKYGEMALKMNPKNEFFLMQLAESYEADNQQNKAADVYYNFIKQMPDQAFFYEKAVFYYMQIQDYDKAIVVLDKMEDQLGIDETVSRQKFEIYSKQGDSKKAVKELQKLVKAFPDKTRFSLNLANYFLQINEISKAKDVYRDILKVDPDNETALQFLEVSNSANSSSELNYIRAIGSDVSNKQISIDDKIAKIMPVVNRLMNEPNQVVGDELALVTQKLIDTYPDDPKAYAIHGDILMMNSNFSSAIGAYSATLKLDGSVFDVWYQLMVAQKQLEKNTDLLKTSEDALLRFPNQGIAYLFHGYALNRLGKSEEAFDILQEAMLFVGQNELLRKNLKTEMAYSRYLEGSFDLASKILDSESILTADAFELRGDIAFSKGNSEEALSHWKKAYELEPENLRIADKISKKQLK